MPALIFIVVVIALCFLIEGFKESFWDGMSLIFGGLTWICAVAGFFTGFGFLIFWPMAFIMFKAFDACATRAGERKTELTPEQKRRKELGYDC